MKKLIVTILIILSVVTMCACNNTDGNNSATPDATTVTDYTFDPDASCDWTGRYVRNGKDENVSSVLEIGQGDSSSFEFQINVDNDGESLLIGGWAMITGNKASYKEDNGRSVEFIMGDNGNIDVKRLEADGKLDKSNNVTGEYTLTNV